MRIALAGRAYSGKTSLAKALVQDGYALWSYTDYLKKLTSRALHGIGVEVTHRDIMQEKHNWRPLLVALSERINFDGEQWVRRFIEEQMRTFQGMPQDIVWDNCRFPEQYEALRDYGFKLVYLDLSDEEQERRSGLDAFGLSAMRHEITEQTFPDVPDMLTYDATIPTNELADHLLWYGRAAAVMASPA